MKIEEIKLVIIKRLKEIRSISSEYSDATEYDELCEMIQKTMLAVVEVETASDIEGIAVYLESIEDYFNSCRSEMTGKRSSEQLFYFDFELDDDADETNRDNAKNNKEEDSSAYAVDIKTKQERIAEIEGYYDKTVERCSIILKHRLKRICSKAIKSVNAARNGIELLEASRTYRKDFIKFTKKCDISDVYVEAKGQYDAKSEGVKDKKLNALRLIAGFIALIGGAAYGFVLDWTTFPIKAIAIMGFGISYLIISMVYLSVEGHRGPKTKRRMAFARLILAVLFLAASILVGIAFEKVGILPMLMITLPFTAGGACVYGFYRIKLFFIANKISRK